VSRAKKDRNFQPRDIREVEPRVFMRVRHVENPWVLVTVLTGGDDRDNVKVFFDSFPTEAEALEAARSKGAGVQQIVGRMGGKTMLRERHFEPLKPK
jgi:hypothetical protein